MTQLIFLILGLMFIAGVIILAGYLNRREHERRSLATLTDATTEQVERFVRDNLGKVGRYKSGEGVICGYDSEAGYVMVGLNNPNGWTVKFSGDKILKKHKSYDYLLCGNNLSLIKITEKP